MASLDSHPSRLNFVVSGRVSSTHAFLRGGKMDRSAFYRCLPIIVLGSLSVGLPSVFLPRLASAAAQGASIH